MRSLLIRGGIAVILLAVLWFFTSQWCSLLVDQIYTPRLAAFQSTPLGWNGVWLQFGPGIAHIGGPEGWSGPALLIGGHTVDFTGRGPDYKQVVSLEVDANGRLALLLDDGNSFVLGSRAGTLPGGDDVIPAFAAGPGNTTSITLEHSLLSWPAPFEINFMTGYSPSWQRAGALVTALCPVRPRGCRRRTPRSPSSPSAPSSQSFGSFPQVQVEPVERALPGFLGRGFVVPRRRVVVEAVIGAFVDMTLVRHMRLVEGGVERWPS